MKKKAGPAAIVAGVVALLIVVYYIYQTAFAPQSPPASRDNMPEYAKQRATMPGQEGAAGGKMVMPYGQRPDNAGAGSAASTTGSAPGGSGAAAEHMPSYGQRPDNAGAGSTPGGSGSR